MRDWREIDDLLLKADIALRSSGHHGGNPYHDELGKFSTGNDAVRKQLNKADAEAAKPGIAAMKQALSPRVTPENIDAMIDMHERELTQAEADAVNTRITSSSRAIAKQHIADHTRMLKRLHELKSQLGSSAGTIKGHHTGQEYPASGTWESPRGSILTQVEKVNREHLRKMYDAESKGEGLSELSRQTDAKTNNAFNLGYLK